MSIYNVAAYPDSAYSNGETIFNDASSAAGASIANGGSTYGAPNGKTTMRLSRTTELARVQIPVTLARQFSMAHQLPPMLPSTTWPVTAAVAEA
jgi:hypothetical protein